MRMCGICLCVWGAVGDSIYVHVDSRGKCQKSSCIVLCLIPLRQGLTKPLFLLFYLKLIFMLVLNV